LQVASEDDKNVFRSFAKENPLMWDTSISVNAPANDSFEILLTDNANEAINAVQNKRPQSEVIYIGDMSEVQNVYASLLDVWPKIESSSIRKTRVEKLLQNLQTRFDAYHYQNLLTTAIDSVPDLVWFKDKIGAHMMVNQEFCNTVHKTKENIRGRGHYYIWDISEEEYKKGEYVCMESEEETMSSGHTCIFDEPLKTSEGMKQLKTYKTPLYDMFGNIEGTVGIAKDVTDFGNMGLELSILVENIPFPLILCDVNWKVLKMNDSFKKLVGMGDTPIEQFSYKEWLQKSKTPINEEKQKTGRTSKEREFEMNIGGESRYFKIIEQEIIDYFQNVSGYFVILNDITVAKEYEKMILSEANTDALTGLYNRRYFEDFINNNVHKPMTLIYMDLDRFKEINDNFGHKRGDQILKGSANFIQEVFHDGLVARWGGDEFTVIMEKSISDDEIKKRCEDLNKKICTLIRASDLQISISYGISKTNGTRNTDEILREADKRMYENKRAKHK
jgi:diguanylate cyclase (GGDEF)-like protein/PAS domain S-box-containing protein